MSGAGDPIVVAIDGAAGSGKSTLARGLARALDLAYLNTGLMYRALALEALERGVDPSDGAELADLLGSLTFTLSSEGDPRELEIQGGSPSPELSSFRVEAVVSEVARHREVRRRMVEVQRRLGARGGIVEGRDIGSVVFPRATAKLFLDAEPEERAARRADEREVDGSDAEEGVAAAMRRRDARDSRTNPHVPAPGATIIETTDLDAEEVLQRALEAVRTARGARGAGIPPAPGAEAGDPP